MNDADHNPDLDPVERMLLLMDGDLQRWSRVGAELEHRKQLFGANADHAPESLLRDVEEGWI